jgi:myo-inositol-1-phosphate synthase
MHVSLAGYHIKDVEISAAIDIDKNKVGKDVSEAIFTWPNNTLGFAKVPRMGVKVQRGMTHDGLGKYLSGIIKKAPGSTVDIVKLLKDTKTDVVVNYLPVGSEEATKWYVEQVLEAGCAFVNCIPVFIAREEYWRKRFEKKGLPVIGDDIKSQVGATITHRVLTRLFVDRGVRIDRMYQLNFGGNTDFLNMLERERLESKKISKTSAVTSIMPYALAEDDIHVGPSDYVPWLKDRKWCHIRMEGTTFGDVPLNLELKLEVWDSPNSAGVVIDCVRCAKLGLDHGLKGALAAPSAYFKKSPPIQVPDDMARELTESYIRDPRGTEASLAKIHGTGTRPKTRLAKKPAKKLAKKAAAGKRRKTAAAHADANGKVSSNGRPKRAKVKSAGTKPRTAGKGRKRQLARSR